MRRNLPDTSCAVAGATVTDCRILPRANSPRQIMHSSRYSVRVFVTLELLVKNVERFRDIDTKSRKIF
jgi:hypothetical protein